MRRRLFLQCYVALLGIVVLFAAFAALGWWLTHDERPGTEMRRNVGALLSEALPPPGVSRTRTEAALARLGRHVEGRISIFGPQGRLLGSLGSPLPAPEEPPSDWRTRQLGIYSVNLQDGRTVLYLPDWAPGHTPTVGFLATLALLVLAVAIGAYPLARRLASRLERLQARVEALGAGDLSARVAVEGKDEVAALAHSFNRAAERIEALVESQRDTLAAASHELRSPLARIRVAVELLAENGDPALRSRAERDIAELDDLIEEILLASRLAGLEPPLRPERIDLQALAAEEAARAGASFSGGPTTVEGESRLLVRLVRNLLDNAACHGAGSPVLVDLEQRGGCAVVRVADRGPGVPEAERERIFEPFYRRADGCAAAGPRLNEDPNDQRGAGLGLSLVRGIARRHGGEAICLPRDGGGACFEVSLPMARTKVAEGFSPSN